MDDAPLWTFVRWCAWGGSVAAAAAICVRHAGLARTWIRTRHVTPRPVLGVGMVLAFVSWAALPVSRARFVWPTRLVILSEGLVWLLLFGPLVLWLRRGGAAPGAGDDGAADDDAGDAGPGQ